MSPFVPFRRMSVDAADEFLEAFVATGPERVAWLRATARLPAPVDVGALVDAWRAYLEWWHRGGSAEDGGPVPIWWKDPVGTEPLAPPALCWVDGLAHYWAAVARAERPTLEWRRWDTGEPMDHIHNHPVLMLPGNDTFFFDPMGTAYTLAVSVWMGQPKPFGRTYAAAEPEAMREVHGLIMRHAEPHKEPAK